MKMATLSQIQADARFNAECEKAEKKANRAANKVRERLAKMEEAEIERHAKAMRKINDARRAVRAEVYDTIYDPLEAAAFKEAELRIDAQ
jgi:hypothetical protein